MEGLLLVVATRPQGLILVHNLVVAIKAAHKVVAPVVVVEVVDPALQGPQVSRLGWLTAQRPTLLRRMLLPVVGPVAPKLNRVLTPEAMQMQVLMLMLMLMVGAEHALAASLSIVEITCVELVVIGIVFASFVVYAGKQFAYCHSTECHVLISELQDVHAQLQGHVKQWGI